MHDFLRKINYENFEVYIPHRHREGFGLNVSAIEKIKKMEGKLIITIDLGITNLEEVELINELGMQVIITDHHLPKVDIKDQQILPLASAIINTKQAGDEYGEKFLCGASTIWKVVSAFLNKYREIYNVSIGFEKWLLDMVAMATIADLVPLQNENRLLAKYGLLVLRKSPRPGLQKMLALAKVNQKNLTEDDIAFTLAPRINSASRMSEPKIAFLALLNNQDSINYAVELENLNQLRKIATKEAEKTIDYENLKQEKIILLGDKNWTPGILGLIASKIVEKTKITTFVWGLGGDTKILKGSVRGGQDNLNVVEIMQGAGKILENYGGHEMAGGFSLRKENLKKFQEFLREYAEKNILEEIKIQAEENLLENIFLELDITEINSELFRQLKIFTPFGVANGKPIFKIKLASKEKINYKRFGKDSEHLEINFSSIRAVEFFVDKNREEELKKQKEFLINLEWDNYRKDIVLKFVK